MSAAAGGALDRRTSAQRLADAQVEMARLAAAQLRLATPGLDPPRVVVHCTPEQLEEATGATGAAEVHGPPDGAAAPGALLASGPGAATCEQTGPISALTLQRHACDAVIERVVLSKRGAVLRMESVGRLANRAQRRALAARDGGCAWLACTAPVSWTEAHHVVWWSRGGPTVVENLVLLCPRHHTEAHQEQWGITVIEGVPWFVPPPWVDPSRVPVRNTLRTAIIRTRHAAQRLARGDQLTPGDVAPGDPWPSELGSG